MVIGSFRKTFWDLFNTPYWYVRIVNDDYRILAEIYTKQTLSKRFIKHKPSKCAYLLPDKLKQVTKKNRIEVTYNYKNAKETKQTSFIQTIAWNNRQKMDLTKSVVDGVSEGLSYIGKYGEIASKIIGVGYSLYEINTKETNSDNPLDIRIVITKSNVQ